MWGVVWPTSSLPHPLGFVISVNKYANQLNSLLLFVFFFFFALLPANRCLANWKCRRRPPSSELSLAARRDKPPSCWPTFPDKNLRQITNNRGNVLKKYLKARTLFQKKKERKENICFNHCKNPAV